MSHVPHLEDDGPQGRPVKFTVVMEDTLTKLLSETGVRAGLGVELGVGLGV